MQLCIHINHYPHTVEGALLYVWYVQVARRNYLRPDDSSANSDEFDDAIIERATHTNMLMCAHFDAA